MQLPPTEALLTQAAISNTREDSDNLFKELRGQEVFFGVNLEKKADPRSGREREVAVSSPLLRLSSGQNAFMIYTSKEDPRLKKPFGGARWERALRMLMDMTDADGLILSSPNRSSIAVDKQNARRVLDLLGESEAPLRARH